LPVAALLALASALAAPVAVAASSASASLSNIHFSLIDLDAGDGIDPSIQFLPDDKFSAPTPSAHARALEGRLEDDHNVVLDRWAAGSVSAQRLNQSASAEVLAGNPFDLGSGAGLRASAAQAAPATAYGYAVGNSQLLYSTPFMLTANTKLVMTGWGEVTIDRDLETPDAVAVGWLDLTIFLYDAVTDEYEIYADDLRVDYDGERYPEVTDPRWLTVSFSNTLDVQTKGYATVHSLAVAYSKFVPPPIPEPASSALLLFGLAAIGVAANRRRRGSR
jgi:hypothetical protein